MKYPLSLRNVEDLLFERGIEIRRETTRFLWIGSVFVFAVEIRRKRSKAMRLQHLLSGTVAPKQARRNMDQMDPAAFA